ncbi:MAG: efflux RND transporter permease subunit [Deltaproteobacteria bacterium]|nr:efflux RND transporter permease subunit [Deltaproteobacteria bacterium]
MFLTKFAIERPVVVCMAFFLIVIFGVYAYQAMHRFLDPDITVGEGIILTLVPGFSAEEMEKLVTKKIEDALKGISDIRRIESRSFLTCRPVQAWSARKKPSWT